MNHSNEIIITAESPLSPDAAMLMEELSAFLEAITGSSGKHSFDVGDVCCARALFAIARQHGVPIGCGAFRPMEDGVAELKRMYAKKNTCGVGTKILSFLEGQARAMGYDTLRLETRLVNEKAISFYERNGYSRISNYGRYAENPQAVCFEKHLSTKKIDEPPVRFSGCRGVLPRHTEIL